MAVSPLLKVVYNKLLGHGSRSAGSKFSVKINELSGASS